LDNKAKSIHDRNEEDKNYEKFKASGAEEEIDYEKVYAEILNHFGIDNENYKNDPKYISLIEGLQKKK